MNSASSNFPVLANYIFGGNKDNIQMEMTSPVLYNMSNKSSFSFVMPKEFEINNLPSPSSEKIFFETWQRLCYNPQTFAMGYYDDYIGSVDIHTMDEQNKKRYGVKLVECFPKAIAAQSLSYSGTGYLTVAVTLSYRYWKNLTDEADLPKPLRDRIEEVVVNSAERQIRAAIPRVLSRL